MTAHAADLPSYDLEEYLTFEEATTVRHEWVGGVVFAMAGGTERHDLMVQALNARLWSALAARGCRVFVHNRKLLADGAMYYPDLLVRCGPAVDRRYEDDADWVVEVLSESTADTDRREKRAAYLALPSLRGYAVVDPDQRMIEVGVPVEGRWRWSTCGPGAQVELAGVVIDLNELYDELDALATT